MKNKKEKNMELRKYIRAEKNIAQDSSLIDIYVRRNQFTNPDEKIIEAVLLLLNKLYEKKIGMGYEEVLEAVKERVRSQARGRER
jgi:hypothetical protein